MKTSPDYFEFPDFAIAEEWAEWEDRGPENWTVTVSYPRKGARIAHVTFVPKGEPAHLTLECNWAPDNQNRLSAIASLLRRKRQYEGYAADRYAADSRVPSTSNPSHPYWMRRPDWRAGLAEVGWTLFDPEATVVVHNHAEIADLVESIARGAR